MIGSVYNAYTKSLSYMVKGVFSGEQSLTSQTVETPSLPVGVNSMISGTLDATRSQISSALDGVESEMI